ncbi:hypothetical protein D3C72_1692570 [compost metagenome]
MTQEAQSISRLGQPVSQRLRCVHRHQAVTAALLTGGLCNALPMSDPFVQPRPGQLQHAALRGNRADTGRAQLHRLFHHPIHLVARRQALYQRDAPGKLGFTGVEVAQRGEACLAIHLKHGVVLTTLAIEQHDGFAGFQPQHAQRMVRQGVRQGDTGAGNKGNVAEKSGGGHGCSGAGGGRSGYLSA